MVSKYNVGDEISIYDPVKEQYITKKIEAICYTNDKIYYLTDSVDLCLLGINEEDLPLPEYQLNINKIKREISKNKDNEEETNENLVTA